MPTKGTNKKEKHMEKARTTLNRLAGVIHHSMKHIGKFFSKIWQAHQEFMSENPSYRELFDLAITAGVRLLRLSPIATIAISAALAGFRERNDAWQ